MATTTPNYGWPVPTSTDLVKNGATAIEALGDAIDASLLDLKGGTTGQVLSKTTNADMDFTWTSPNPGDITSVTATSPLTGGGTSGDVTIGILSGTTSNLGAVQLSTSTSSTSTSLAATASAVKSAYDLANAAIPNAIVDAKGDLIAASAADTPARLAVGSNGETLVADSSTSTGLRYTALFGANKNKIINGDFFVNQRSFTSLTCSGTDQYGFDRWLAVSNTGTVTYSTQAFTAGAAPVAGYEGTNFARLVTSGQSGTTAYAILSQKIEDVRTFANQTITVSFWAKAATGTPKIAVEMSQGFGSGGSAQANTYAGQATISTSWARYSVTVAVPTISGKTIGAGNAIAVNLWVSSGTALDSRTGSIGIQTGTFDVWGVQAEAGSVATAFQTATGTIQGELAACQRYYWRGTGAGSSAFASGSAATTTGLGFNLPNPVTMRVNPTAVEFSTLSVYDNANVGIAATAVTLNSSGITSSYLGVTVASGATALRPYILGQTSGAGYLAISAEL